MGVTRDNARASQAEVRTIKLRIAEAWERAVRCVKPFRSLGTIVEYAEPAIALMSESPRLE